MTVNTTLLDASTLLSEANSLMEAVFMAAGSIGDRHATSALQNVVMVAQGKLEEVQKLIDRAREVKA